MNLKVGFIARDTIFSGLGGDSIQMLNTAKYLRELGVEVDLFRTSQKIDYNKYDILHGFNIIRPADLLPHFDRFKGVKVISTIYVDYFEYEAKVRGGLAGKVFRSIGRDNTEYLKTVLRWIRNGEKNFSYKYLLMGHRRSLRKLVRMCDMLLPNSRSEYERLAADYGVAQRFKVINNAIDVELFKAELDIRSMKEKDLVICVAKIDGRKNQLNLIRALNNSRFRLILIGKSTPNQKGYYQQCQAEAAANVSFVTELDQSQLLSYYLRAKVHAMPSWFETTGLSSLEAAALGCNLVISSKGDTREYFGDAAFYGDPGDIKSIFGAVSKAADTAFDNDFRDKIYREYTWQNAAGNTLAAYKTCLSDRN